MSTVMLVAAAVVLALAALLAVPLSLVVRVERTTRTAVRVRVRWLFGLVDVEPGRGREPAAAGKEETPAKPRRKETRRGRGRRRARMALAILQSRGFLRRALRLPADLVGRVRFEAFHLHAAFGLDDPADTGRLYGALTPVLAGAAAGRFDVRCHPVFERPCLEGSCGATIRVRPLAVAGVVVAFVCSPAMLRALVAAWRAR